jgi:porphobilinogen synthase
MVMVKPAGPYLDVIATIRQHATVPVVAYQVSGEYAMIEAGVSAGWLDRRMAVEESLRALHRAGADLLLTYYAKRVAGWHRGLSGVRIDAVPEQPTARQ